MLTRVRIALILFICLLFVSSLGCFASEYYEEGKRAFYKEKYPQALQEFNKEIEVNPRNINCRYYLAQTLIKLGYVDSAKKQYQIIIQTAPDSQAAHLSKLGLKYINEMNKPVKPKVKQADKVDSYIETAYFPDKKVVRWNKEKMPVKVFIDKKKLPKDSEINYQKLIKQAFKEWEYASNGVLSFKYVRKAEKSNISVTFEPEIKDSKNKSVTSLTTHYFSGNELQYANMQLILSTALIDKQFYNITIHEIGHALGIYGHSNNPKDVMYSVPVSREQDNTIFKTLSERDANTIKILYSLEPYISNF